MSDTHQLHILVCTPSNQTESDTDQGRNGKNTTTAKHMGRIFYDMGFLSTTEVIEYSAADLVGQYVGQTTPKTRRNLEEAVGRVLCYLSTKHIVLHTASTQPKPWTT
jgi:hypothetical protein